MSRPKIKARAARAETPEAPCPAKCGGRVTFGHTDDAAAEPLAMHTLPYCKWFSDPAVDALDVIRATRESLGLPDPNAH